MKEHGGRGRLGMPGVRGRLAAKACLLAGIFLFLVALIAVRPLQARADGGVWPSPTPTFGPSPTAGGFVPFVPTPTVAVFALPEITVEPAAVVIATLPPTETAVIPTPVVQPSASRTLCWPFALGFILILILGSIALIGRRV